MELLKSEYKTGVGVDLMFRHECIRKIFHNMELPP